ncbi:hypothetical protein ABZ454_09235 [Streptomyces sp. NPDC005803]|uniref:hypothetical protein n=1 Tax=Streptomyces sp. NPDC005803 TaxID=3154297 RepID=UPI0033CDA0F7
MGNPSHFCCYAVQRRNGQAIPLRVELASGRIRSGFLGIDKAGSAVSRADIAAFPISQITDTRYRRARPAIGN